jgi:hypothetical protein
LFAAPPASVNIRDSAKGETHTIATLDFPPLAWDGTLTASPDGRYALITEMTREGSEIHLRPSR